MEDAADRIPSLAFRSTGSDLQASSCESRELIIGPGGEGAGPSAHVAKFSEGRNFDETQVTDCVRDETGFVVV